jgi:DNA ligase-1
MVLLAKNYENQSPRNWYMSEKLDGVRAIWTGRDFVSRNGNKFNVPDEFKQGLPDIRLDGELWIARAKFQSVVGLVRKKYPQISQWKNVKYMVFDAPEIKDVFQNRLNHLQKLNFPNHVKVVEHKLCRSANHLDKFENKIVENGGEGVMLRDPLSYYENKRSDTLLKIKSHDAAEAIVVGYKDGKGKHSGQTGALICKNNKGVTFAVGTVTNAQRDKPPQKGSKITFLHQGLTDGSKPRSPVFLAIRNYE